MPIPQPIEAFLNERTVPFEVIHHRRDYTAQEAAADTHTPGKAFAKTVILNMDNRFCMVVLPAHHSIDFEKAKRSLGAKDVRLATENEVAKLCPDCEVGAMPPFGMMYDMPVYVSPPVLDNPYITFNAGTHEDAIRIPMRDFEKLVQPKVADFTAGT